MALMILQMPEQSAMVIFSLIQAVALLPFGIRLRTGRHFDLLIALSVLMIRFQCKVIRYTVFLYLEIFQVGNMDQNI